MEQRSTVYILSYHPKDTCENTKQPHLCQLANEEKWLRNFPRLNGIFLKKLKKRQKTEQGCWQAYWCGFIIIWLPLGSSVVKNLPAIQKLQKVWVKSLGQEDPLEEGMATHSSILAWRIPWTEEPGGLHSIGLQRVGYDWSNLAHTHYSLVKKIRSDRLSPCKCLCWTTILKVPPPKPTLPGCLTR